MKHFNPTKLLAIILAATMAVFTFTACGASETKKYETKEEKVEKKDLIVFAAASMTETLEQLKTDYEADHPEINIVYTRYINTLTYRPTTLKLLPFEIDEDVKTEEILLEPSRDEVLNRLIPMYVSSQIYVAFLEAKTSENAARRNAMNAANKNAEKLISEEFPDVPSDITDKCIRCMKALKEGLGMQESPLMQVGIELNADMKFKSFKYYLCVEKTKHPKENLAEAMAGFAEAAGVCSDTGRMDRLIRDVCTCWYRPTFIGVNDGAEETEAKLYFISEIFGHALKTKPAGQTERISEILGFDKGLTEELMTAWEQAHLYLQGLAVTFGDPSVLRLYLRELQEAYFR